MSNVKAASSEAYANLGIKETMTGKAILWIADPHKTSRKDGLYYLVLDNMGKKIHSTGVDDGKNGLHTAQTIDPDKKGWMLWLPQHRNLV